MREEQAMTEDSNLELNRRSFLQSASVMAAGAALLRATAATAQTGTPAASIPASYPPMPKLAEKPLKESTLNTPGISRKTHEEHFKLYQGYVKKTNELFDKLATVSRDPKMANATYSEIREVKLELSFALGGVKNHELYFDILGSGAGSKPIGTLLDAMNHSFGSPEAWAADLRATGLAARGWVWTAYDYDLKRLMNYIGDAQNAYPIWNATPIVGLDVYEHAYFMDYGTKRADYIEAFLQNLNWNVVAIRFALASGPGGTLVTPAA